MGRVNNLEIYGDQIIANLNLFGKLDLKSLSHQPSLAFFRAKQLQDEFSKYLNSYYSTNPTLRSHYEEALLEIAKAALPTKEYNIDTYINYFQEKVPLRQEKLIEIDLSKSRSDYFSSDGVFLGKVKIIDKNGVDISNKLLVSALAEPYIFRSPENFENDQLVLLIKGTINEGETIGIDFDNDSITDINIGPLDYDKTTNQLIFDNLFTSDAAATSISEPVLKDIVIEVRDPNETEKRWKDWNPVSISRVSTLWGDDLKIYLNNNAEEELKIIPSNWKVRLSYDDLINEDISEAELEKHDGIYLIFDEEIINQIFKALADGKLEDAQLEIGPNLNMINFNLKDYKNSSELYTAISSVNWIGTSEDNNTRLQLKSITPREGLVNFKVKFMIKPNEKNYEQIYNTISLAYKKENEWELADPDGYSLIDAEVNNLDKIIIKIDRYGDKLNAIGLEDEGSIIPEWQRYNPSFNTSTNLRLPWNQQTTNPKAIEIIGNKFDSGDDILIKIYHEIEDDPKTQAWEGAWKEYALIIDMYDINNGNNKLNEEQQQLIFSSEITANSDANYKQNYYFSSLISNNEDLNVDKIFNLFKKSLENFIYELKDENLNNFDINLSKIEKQKSYQVLEGNIDFTAAPGLPKPSITMYTRFIDDENNAIEYEKAWQLYYDYPVNNLENVYNYGTNLGEFEWASTNPLSNEANAKQLIYFYFKGMAPIAEISEKGSSYREGDINLIIDNKQINPTDYVMKLSKWDMQIIFTDESKLEISENSVIIFSLKDDHGLKDISGKKIIATKNLEVQNYANWQSSGFNPSKQLILNPTESYVDRNTVNLAFFGEANLSLDSSKVEAPELDDFQFWSFNNKTGKWSDEPLKLNSVEPIKIGKRNNMIEFNLAEPIGSDVKIEVSYDPAQSTLMGEKPFTDINKLIAESFYWQPIENKSPDEEGPIISWAIVAGKHLSLQLDDPSGIAINNIKLNSLNLPNPSDFVIKTNNHVIQANSINLSNLGYLELGLEKDVDAGVLANISYVGSTMRDGLGNLPNIRETVVENYTIEFNRQDAKTWFQNNDQVNIVFNKKTDPLTGWFLNESGALSAENNEYQIQDDYIFQLDNLSKVTVNLSDQGNLSLDDSSDANLDFVIENLNTGKILGGSWNSKNDTWLTNPTNDERNINYILPEGNYKLSVYHAETWQNNKQNYQLEINYSPYSLQASQLSKQDYEKDILIKNDTDNKSIYIELLDEGLLKLSSGNKDLSSAINLYTVDGEWLNSSYTDNLSQYVVPGLYRIEYSNWSTQENDIRINATLDSTIVLNIDNDTKENPNGSVVVNGIASKGELNSLDNHDFWKLKLMGKKIYSIRATNFKQDVNIIIENNKSDLIAESWNWGYNKENGEFIYSDETIILDLSSSQYIENTLYEFTLEAISYDSNPTQYSLIAKEHLNLNDAKTEVGKDIYSYEDVHNLLFDDSNSLDKDILTAVDLKDIASLRNVSNEKLTTLKAELEQQKVSINGPILGLENLLSKQNKTSNDQEINTILINKQYPSGLLPTISNKLKLSEPGELVNNNNKVLQFGAKEISELIKDVSKNTTEVKPISKTVNLKVESKQGRVSGFLLGNSESNRLSSEQALDNKEIEDNLGLQRICINLDEETKKYITENPDQTLVWFKSPVNGNYSIFDYDNITGTGSLLESNNNMNIIDTMVLYIQDGGRGDDDKLINGQINAPGGLAFVKLIKSDQANDEITNWKADLDNDGLISPLSDGLALAKRFSAPMIGMDSTLQKLLKKFDTNSLNSLDKVLNSNKLDIDKSGKVDLNDMTIIIRHSFGTYPGGELTKDLNLIGNTSLNQIYEQIELMQPNFTAR